ncbi:MAG: hypothetical protein RBU29_15325, partial [bacterium]|nr:hypothetical protein [bacterium]
YMLFLLDEYDANRDIKGDRIYQTVLRMFHFDTRQVVNVGTPARSATPRPDETRYEFEVILDDHLLLFSNDEDGRNTDTNLDAPWYAINMLDIIYKIEGTPTPTPSPSPIPTPTLPEFTPTPTPINPVDPATRARSDINQDGRIDAQDLLIFQLDWKADRLLME